MLWNNFHIHIFFSFSSSFFFLFSLHLGELWCIFFSLHPLKFHYMNVAETHLRKLPHITYSSCLCLPLSLSLFPSYSVCAHKILTIVVLWRPSELIWHNMAQDNLKRMNILTIRIFYANRIFGVLNNHETTTETRRSERENNNILKRNKIRLRNRNDVGRLLVSNFFLSSFHPLIQTHTLVYTLECASELVILPLLFGMNRTIIIPG